MICNKSNITDTKSNMGVENTQSNSFYDSIYRTEDYAFRFAEGHPDYFILKKKLGKIKAKIGISNPKCLEIGSGRGGLQDVEDDYTGVDISISVKNNYHKDFCCASATDLPFDDNTFDIVWSMYCLEHVHDPEKALKEILRVTKTGGYILMNPAWHCRKWAADGYQVRPYSDFKLGGKIYKFIIPFLDNVVVRSVAIIPVRLRAILYYIYFKKSKNMPFLYRKIRANYEVYWQADSDACNDMDPLSLMLWFESRGHEVISHHKWINKLTSTHGYVDIIKK